jgi:hypothetical protein
VRGEGGQATVEWVALVLLAALLLGGLAAARNGLAGDAGLGEAVAQRITCAAGDLCGRAGAGGPSAGPPIAPPRLRRSPGAGALQVREARAADARRLRGVTAIAEHAWIVCLAYRRWRAEMEHPRAPTEALPLDEALGIANECLNPLEFFFP